VRRVGRLGSAGARLGSADLLVDPLQVGLDLDLLRSNELRELLQARACRLARRLVPLEDSSAQIVVEASALGLELGQLAPGAKEP
jgi:hypothetical protein